ncbi:hypothetical protein [Jannaschia sp. LMIT008]|uniref:hypothetical protein n=1 Tax=Jannaschia maritima TaxID=3032585 RepID=UPI002810EF96|nr:hypothetical protein [Jannaschia sp. LMIT008]
MIGRYLEWRLRKARPPVALGLRAARWGAVACLAGIVIAAFPVAEGWRDARDGQARAKAAGEPFTVTWDGAEGVEALRRLGAMMAVGR